LTHTLENVATWPFREVHIDDEEIGTNGRLSFKRLDKPDRLVAISDYQEVAVDTVLFQRLSDQTHIRGIIFDQKNGKNWVSGFATIL
jgi:hypothetical protein